MSERFTVSRIAEIAPNKILRSIFAVGIAAATFVSISPSASAASECYGSSCTGLDPKNRCDDDAKTVSSIKVMHKDVSGLYLGQLELRYSPSCAANWGRFTLATGPREFIAQLRDTERVMGGRVTAWNPGQPSQGEAHDNGITAWTRMVDGTKVACTGVEAYAGTGKSAPDVKSNGWTWGPCI